MAGIYDFKVPKRDGSELALSDYRGKVIIIVNTATGCGFTPHYEPLEQMYEEYAKTNKDFKRYRRYETRIY